MLRQSLLGFVVLALISWHLPAAQDGKKLVKPSKEWSGSVDDEALQKQAPAVITSAMDLEKIWKSWKLADKVPAVDFTKDILVVTTTRGSRLRLFVNLDDKGNLQVGGLSTRDLRPGFRYVMGAVSREGVKTVNGKELGKK